MNDDERTRDLGRGRAEFDTGDTLPAKDAGGGPSSPAMRVGTQVGRYLLEDELGRGGMGVVYAAFDPELDRRVAIKLLRTAAVEGSEGKARLQREAQALARLAHPNVVSVFDVGVAGDDIFVAMELSTGGTLREWQRDRIWPELIAAYLQAGRGLAAAHAAGLVHRDFKPDNVLVGTDGRLRVTDFGLVRAAGAAPMRAPTRATAIEPSSTTSTSGRYRTTGELLASDLTEAGSVMGTPMYMAPEQMTGGVIEAAADQFAFCVSLWQALHGESPFAALEMAKRLVEIQRGQRQPPRNPAVPSRINRVLVRGLGFVAAERWPTLDALLAAIEQAARPQRRLIAVGAVVMVVGGGAAIALAAGGREAGPCGSAAASADPWSARRGAVQAAFTATQAAFAADAFGFVDQRLSAFEAELRAQRISTCRDTRERHTQTPTVDEQRQACLGARQHRAIGLVEVLSHADRALLERIDQVMVGLPSLEGCADLEVLAGKRPRPSDPTAARELVDLERRIAAVDATLDPHAAGSVPAEARTAVDAAVADADRLGYAPTQAEVRIVRARLARVSGDHDAARKDLVEAAAAATRGSDRARLAEAYLALLFLDSEVRADYPAAESWSQLAGAAVDALGAPLRKRVELIHSRAELARGRGEPAAAVEPLEALLAEPALIGDDRRELQGELALVRSDLGDHTRAEQLFDQLIASWTETIGADHPKVLSLRTNRANQLYFRGEFAKCRDAQREILAARERVLGPDHPGVATSLEALGVCENKGGDAASGRDHLLRAVAIFKQARGPEHPDTLAAMSDLGGAYSHLGDHAAALAINQELLAIRERILPKDHPDLGISLVNSAIEAKNAGQLAVALGYHERALGIFERSLGAEHPNVGIGLINYGEALRIAGRHVAAIAAFQRAGRIIAKAFGDDHVVMAHVWYGLGQAELARGRAGVAVTWLEQAVTRRTGVELDRNELAEAEFALAQALVAASGERPRARQLAERAIAAWSELGAGFTDERAAAVAWLARPR